VLHNLLRNALEATEQHEDARITVGTRRVAHRDSDMVEIRVADNGPGFVPEIIDQAFDPYVTSKPRGTGLGLAIVKKLIEEHGGQIAARNLKDRGAELSVLLPLAEERHNETKEQRRVENRKERA
jgi:nitrogen fixation/metabolism regulation signal transduction histidine kinase